MRFARLILSFGSFAPWMWGQFLPQIAVTPGELAADSGETKLTISGKNFTNSLQVLWNGQPRVTQFIDTRTLKAIVTGNDVELPGLAQISLFDTAQGTAASDPVPMLVYLPLQGYDMAYDPLRSRVYVSVSLKDPSGPSLAVFNPENGVVDRFIPLPSEPGPLALSDDSRYVYIALQDRVRRIDLTGGSPDLDILNYTSSSGTKLTAFLLLAVPGQGSSVIVGLDGDGEDRLIVYDGATPRPGLASVNIGVGMCLIGGPTASTIYASGGGGFYSFQLDKGGFLNSFQGLIGLGQPGLLEGSGCAVYASGFVYDGNGDVIDPAALALVGRFGASGLVGAAPESNRFYVVETDTTSAASIMAFDLKTRQLLQTATLPLSAGLFAYGRMIHLGKDGIGFAEGPRGYQVYLGHPTAPFSHIHMIHLPLAQ